MILRAAQDSDRDAIIALLEEESLPTSDLATQPLDQFIVAEERGIIVGCIGAEVSARTALLRSLVVARSHRRRRIAGRLVDALENALAAAGVADIWLLTIDADGYFKKPKASQFRKRVFTRIHQA